MDKKLLAIGGTVIIAGGLIYWYLSRNGNGIIKCSDFTNQTDCEANACYWCDGKCQSTPCNKQPCTEGISRCFPNVTGLRQCDRYKNLCQCNGSKWNLVEKDSSTCHNGIYYTKCYANANGQVTCIPYMGQGTDECMPMYPTGCPCPPGTYCQTGFSCEPNVMRCVQDAMGTHFDTGINNWDECYSTPRCPAQGQPGYSCRYSLEKDPVTRSSEYYASKLIGTFEYEWGFPLGECEVMVLGYLEGVGWTELGTKKGDMWGTEGSFPIALEFPPQGISKLAFECCGTMNANVKPKRFYGNLSII